MYNVEDVLKRIEMYKAYGFERPEAIEIVKIERLVAINNRLKELNESIKAETQQPNIGHQ